MQKYHKKLPVYFLYRGVYGLIFCRLFCIIKIVSYINYRKDSARHEI